MNQTWTLTATHPDGEIETIEISESGRLQKPYVSDALTLTRLIGFGPPFTSAVGVDLETATRHPEHIIGLQPMFLTTLDQNTALRARTTQFELTSSDGRNRS